MYAIIEVGGKQFTVKKDDIIDVEKQDIGAGIELNLDKVLLVAKDQKLEVGRPYLKNAKVTALALEQIKAKKVISYKYRRRKASHSKKGHRQQLTRLKIKKIEADVH